MELDCQGYASTTAHIEVCASCKVTCTCKPTVNSIGLILSTLTNQAMYMLQCFQLSYYVATETGSMPVDKLARVLPIWFDYLFTAVVTLPFHVHTNFLPIKGSL